MIYLIVVCMVSFSFWAQITFIGLMNKSGLKGSSWVNLYDLSRLHALKEDPKFIIEVRRCKRIYKFRLLFFYIFITYCILSLFA